MTEQQPPLVLFMDNTHGEEVSITIDPTDNFQTFLSNATSTLGYTVDLNSITRNQPVSLSDNIYEFLVTSDRNLASQLVPMQPMKTFDQMLEPNADANDLVYILDDGTQIRASQIHFDNEDPQVDITAEKIPFIKYIDDGEDDFDTDNVGEEDIVKFNIAKSPVPRWSNNDSNPNCSFANTLPFKLVCNNTSAFEAQFTKYLESSTAKTYTTLNPVTNRNKSPRSLIRDNYKNYDDKFARGDDFTGYTREEILNMFKDSPVTPLPYEAQNLNEKRRRKTDPSRGVHKNWNSKPANYDDGILIGDTESQNCFICGKFVANNMEKLYLFDKEDQILHRSSPQKKSSRQLKIICESCLGENFKPCRMKGPNQSLNSDEYLVIKNNQQYIFQKTNKIDFKNNRYNEIDDVELMVDKSKRVKEKVEFVKVEIGSDGEIVTKPIDNDPRSSDDVIIVKDEDKEGSSSDVEIIEPPEIDENIIDNLEDADEEVKEFLGKYQRDSNLVTELKCRFCEHVFGDLSEVMNHVDEHKHETDDGAVYPCPLCDYGYANSKWLKGHIKAAHERSKDAGTEDKTIEAQSDVNDNNSTSVTASPIAKRTRSSLKKSDDDEKGCSEKPIEENAQIITNAESVTYNTFESSLNTMQSDSTSGSEPISTEKTPAKSTITIKTEVKQEALESSDDEIWIVQTGDDVETEQIETLLHAAKVQNDDAPDKSFKCPNCSQTFSSEEGLSTHRCKTRRRKKNALTKDGSGTCVPTQEDFIRRAQGRPRISYADQSDSDLVVKPRRRKTKEPSSDPQIVTCHNCNESFTSKVRLKFHMQFHSPSRASGPACYTCPECNIVCGTEAELFDHVHFQHDKQKRWKCPVKDCGKTFFLRATLTKHSRTHTDTRRYVCVTCGKRFFDKQTLDEHGVTHLQIKPFQCHICLKQLTRRSRLRMHLRAHEEELTLQLVLVCAVCRRAFRDHADAQDHAAKSGECIEEFVKELKEEAEEPTVQLSPTSGNVRQPPQREKEPSKLSGWIPRQVPASVAEPLLSSLGDEARGIIRVVEIEKAFRCEYCEDVFYLEDVLNAHRVIHKGVKNPFTCHICKVSFATYSRCTTHKTTHGFYKRSLAEVKKNARPRESEAGPSATGILGYGGFPVVKHFLCEDCGRSYLHWTYLQVHRRMKHANEVIRKCDQCELTFSNRWSLAYHKKKMHGNTGQSDTNVPKIAGEGHRIPCRDCDELLPNKTALYKHRKKEHSDMTRVNSKSNVCCSQFGTHSERDGHSCSRGSISLAPSTSAAACVKCGDSFAQMSDLHKHVEQCRRGAGGAGAGGHACGVCARVFRSASVRDEHLRTHTGERPFPCDVCGLAFRRSTAMRNHRLIHTGVRAWACERCPKRFRIRSDLRTHARLKHPAHLAVIEVQGLNPTPDEVMEHLAANNISHDKVIEITKMSFAKGTVSIIPTCARALSMLGDVPRTQVAYSKPVADESEEFQPPRRGRGIAKNPRRPKSLPREGDDLDQGTNPYPITINVTGGELTDVDVQLLLRDGVLTNGNQMVELQLSDSQLLE